MYGGGDSAMGLFPLSAAFLSAGGIGTRGKPLETVGRKARGCGAGQPHYARSAAIRQTVGNGGAAKPEAKAHLRYARSVTEFFASKNGQRREDLFMKNSKIFRRGFAWLLTLSMCLGMLQVTAFAEETEAGAGGDVTVSVVNVSSDAPQVSSSDTAAAQQESSTPPADTPSSDAADTEDSTAPADSSDNTENPENDTPKADDSEDAEDSESPVLPAVDSDDETDENNADKQAEQNDVEQDNAEQAEEETPETAEKEDSEQDGAFDLTQTERPEQSDTVSVGTGTTENQTEGSTPESGKNWEIFYDKENDVYKLTFNIDSDAEGDQVIDMTYALKLLNQYAQSGKAELEAKKEEMRAELEDSEDYQQYKVEYAEYEKAHAEDMVAVKQILTIYGSGYDITDKSDDELIAEFDKQFGTMFGELAKKPEIPESIKGQLEAIEKLDDDFKNRTEADVLEPGDIRKFMIFLSSSSNHTYKYQEGSFTLATPDFGLGNNPEDGILGFDGQILPDKYVDKAEYHVTLRCEPIRELLTAMGFDSFDVFNGPHGEDRTITEYLKVNYGGETVAESMNNYILAYYNSKDGTEYASIDELVKNNPDAKAELTKTETSGNKWFTLNGEKFVVDVHLEAEKYNRFYEMLFSFAYGNEEDLDEILTWFDPEDDCWKTNTSWTFHGAQNALYYYMAHKEIWETTDKYFQELLKEGLTADQATWASFMMALNIDGELTGNDWQNTQWPWYNSIKLEQMDIDFSLTKTDGETGEAITDSETGFQVYYIDKVKSDDGTVSDVKMYCSYDAETNSYTFVPTESTVWTKDGKLDINYAMMKDIVYYLQETVAPEGYERDANVYIIMNEEDYNAMSDEDKAALGKFDKFLETQKSEDGLKVSVEFTNAKVKIPTTTPEEPTPPPTPEEPDRPTTPDEPDRDPDVDVPEPEVPLSDMPEEPFVSISEEDVPLADTPEEVEIDDPEVPMGDVPRTGDAPVFPLAAAALCICGMLLAKLGKGSKEM